MSPNTVLAYLLWQAPDKSLTITREQYDKFMKETGGGLVVKVMSTADVVTITAISASEMGMGDLDLLTMETQGSA